MRSYLADGRLVQWRPPHEANPEVRAWAVDAEITAQEVPPALAVRYGGDSPQAFWVAWTRVEVVCKLLAVPVGKWLAEHGLDVSAAAGRGVAWCTEAVGDITVTVGGCFDRPGRAGYRWGLLRAGWRLRRNPAVTSHPIDETRYACAYVQPEAG